MNIITKMLLARGYCDENNGEGGEGGGGSDNDNIFLSSLPEDLRGNASLTDFKDVGSLAKSFVDLKSFQGSSLRIPGEDAGDEDIAAFNQKILEKVPGLMQRPDMDNPEKSREFLLSLGMPAEAAGYDLSDKVDATQGEFLRGLAHEAGLTKTQFNTMIEKVIARDTAAAEKTGNLNAEDHKALKEKWGLAYDDKMKNVAAVARGTNAPEGLVEAIASGVVSSDLAIWMDGLATKLGSEGMNISTQSDPARSNRMSPEEAKSQINEIYANKQHAFFDQSNMGHKDALKKMENLIQFAYPDK